MDTRKMTFTELLNLRSVAQNGVSALPDGEAKTSFLNEFESRYNNVFSSLVAEAGSQAQHEAEGNPGRRRGLFFQGDEELPANTEHAARSLKGYTWATISLLWDAVALSEYPV